METLNIPRSNQFIHTNDSSNSTQTNSTQNSNSHSSSSSTYSDNSLNYASSPINITEVQLIDGTEDDASLDCDRSDGCLGFVLPGDVFRISYAFEDFWDNATLVIVSCAQMIYNISQAYLEIEEISIQLDDQAVHVELTIEDAQYDTTVAVNVTDLHYMVRAQYDNALVSYQKNETSFNPRSSTWDLSDYAKYYYSTFSVITTLCPTGSSVSIYSEGSTICNNTQMTGVSFTCDTTCSGSEYLFTRWEPSCHDCPSSGATCSGGDEVILDYGYYGHVTTEKSWTDPPDSGNDICIVRIATYLCPSDLCCGGFDGCKYKHTTDTMSVLCAENRNSSVPFCGRCNDGYSEVYGSYSCSDKCDKDNLILVFIPIFGCMALLMYLLLRDPTRVTELFSYIYKSLLYFYQILPILTYESYLSLIDNVVSVFSIDIIAAWDSNGACLIAGMTSLEKLLSNFGTPVILLCELFLLRLLPYLGEKIVYYTYYSKEERDNMNVVHAIEIHQMVGYNMTPNLNSANPKGGKQNDDDDDDDVFSLNDKYNMTKDNYYGMKAEKSAKTTVLTDYYPNNNQGGVPYRADTDRSGLSTSQMVDASFSEVQVKYDEDPTVRQIRKLKGDKHTPMLGLGNKGGGGRSKKDSFDDYEFSSNYSHTRPGMLTDRSDANPYNDFDWDANSEDENFIQANICERLMWHVCCFGCFCTLCKRNEHWNIGRIVKKLGASIESHFLDAFWNAILILYITIAQSAIKMFNCSTVANESYLWYAGEHKCGLWWQYPFILLFIVVLLFPFYIVWTLWRLKRRSAISKRTGERKVFELSKDKLERKRRRLYAAFTATYRTNCWWYEAVMMGRRLVLVSIYAFPKSNLYLLRSIIAFSCGIILCIHIKFQPFKEKINNHLETGLLILLFFIASLSTISETDGVPIQTLIVICAVLPLCALPFLFVKYWRKTLKPGLMSLSEKRINWKARKSGRKSRSKKYSVLSDGDYFEQSATHDNDTTTHNRDESYYLRLGDTYDPHGGDSNGHGNGNVRNKHFKKKSKKNLDESAGDHYEKLKDGTENDKTPEFKAHRSSTGFHLSLFKELKHAVDKATGRKKKPKRLRSQLGSRWKKRNIAEQNKHSTVIKPYAEEDYNEHGMLQLVTPDLTSNECSKVGHDDDGYESKDMDEKGGDNNNNNNDNNTLLQLGGSQRADKIDEIYRMSTTSSRDDMNGMNINEVIQNREKNASSKESILTMLIGSVFKPKTKTNTKTDTASNKENRGNNNGNDDNGKQRGEVRNMQQSEMVTMEHDGGNNGLIEAAAVAGRTDGKKKRVTENRESSLRDTVDDRDKEEEEDDDNVIDIDARSDSQDVTSDKRKASNFSYVNKKRSSFGGYDDMMVTSPHDELRQGSLVEDSVSSYGSKVQFVDQDRDVW